MILSLASFYRTFSIEALSLNKTSASAEEHLNCISGSRAGVGSPLQERGYDLI
jgi:hypothetical protein